MIIADMLFASFSNSENPGSATTGSQTCDRPTVAIIQEIHITGCSPHRYILPYVIIECFEK